MRLNGEKRERRVELKKENRRPATSDGDDATSVNLLLRTLALRALSCLNYAPEPTRR